MTSPPRKRARSEDGAISIGRHTSDSIHRFHTHLRAQSADLKTLTDSYHCVSLVFPSLLRTSIRIFPGQHERMFSHMGLPIVQEIGEQIQCLQAPSSLVLLGTYGAGKSHLLSVLASFLFAQGKRVVFLPECPLIAEDTVFGLKLAFSVAFADDPQTMQRILLFNTTSDFVQFARECHPDIYFLVHGFDQVGRDFRDVITATTASHFFIYTAYALDTLTSRHAPSVRIRSGFTSDEFAQWVHHYEDQLPIGIKNYMPYIEYISGGVPYFLYPLFGFGGKKCVDSLSQYRMGPHFETLVDQVAEGITATEKHTASQKSRYSQLMNACLTETIPEARPGANAALYDPRYFYFDKDRKGHCVCGVARDVMIDFFRAAGDMSLFTSDAWYTCVRSGNPNPSLRQSAIVQICLTRIGVGGLSQADAQGHAMRILTFRHTPNFGAMFEEAWSAPHVCKFVSAVILRISPRDKMAHLIPLQVAVGQGLTCVDLATSFFAVVWHQWEAAIREEGFNVVNTFVCIDSLAPESEEVIRMSNDFREKVKFVSPAYTVRNLNAAQLDPKLGRILKPEEFPVPETSPGNVFQ
ncbi:hypothetical protein GGX14DRAFT_436816 [Mycena pura]|uniref:Uncharacterized protein n=1 Tax=Mycena pura TaxID=153505 RepID=A0AAD6VU13_9AGAR|nr:hypothetical protein GGX14DRAFT_436816 [Mycena pura]